MESKHIFGLLLIILSAAYLNGMPTPDEECIEETTTQSSKKMAGFDANAGDDDVTLTTANQVATVKKCVKKVTEAPICVSTEDTQKKKLAGFDANAGDDDPTLKTSGTAGQTNCTVKTE